MGRIASRAWVLRRHGQTHQVLSPGLAAPRRTNLPPETTSFVGREQDLDAVGRAFASGCRLVTVLGPAGTGKTRLARRFAARALDAAESPGGVWFCDLSEARSREDITSSVAAALGVPAALGDPVAQIAHALAGRPRVLVVLDNFEQIVACAGGTLGRWLASAPESRWLVTSRERLRIEGETCVDLAPLPHELGARLFEERARAVRASFVVSEANAADVGELVRRLDGLPLAIELAAARANVLPPKKLLERLVSRFDVLKSSIQDRARRQLTLRGAIDWSWDLLSDRERGALMRCSIFRGGFALEAAEAVLPPPALDLIEALVDRSLVRRYEPEGLPGEVRFGLYESIREYAAEKLDASGVRIEALARHCAHYLDQGEAWATGLSGPDVAGCLARLRLEADNLLAVHRRAIDDAPDVSARAALALDALLSTRGPFEAQLELLETAVAVAPPNDAALTARVLLARGQAWRARGDRTRGRDDLDRAREHAGRAADAVLEATVLAAIARDDLDSGHPDQARSGIERSLGLARGAGERKLEAGLLGMLGQLQLKQNRLHDARLRFEAALALHRAVGNRIAECGTLGNLGIVDHWQWRDEQAEDDYRRALAIAQELGDRREEAVIRTNLALLHGDRGQFDAARKEFEEALRVQREAGYRQFVGMSIGGLGTVDHAVGRLEDARRRYEESLGIFRELGHRRYEIASLRYLGVLALDEGNPKKALELLEQALSIAREVHDLSGFVLGPLGAALAALDRIVESRAAFAAAAEDLAARGEPRAIPIVALFEGFLDLALARDAESRGKHAEASDHRGRARQRLDPAGPGGAAARSSDARVAANLLERGLGDAVPSSRGGTTLEVGPNVAWFRIGRGKKIDLRQRRALRLLLGKLIAAARESPGRGLSVHELVEAGWPGEKILPDAAVSRVYTSIKTLRHLGLRDLLVHGEDGYVLDPATRVVPGPT